ncbi:Acyltransferase family [Yersinia thracica]|uniref:Acyltransferase family n=2 Tax=Yersinia thracica TaxID=2890319 RepID=A0A0T9R2F0_9GAMM|nr:Acyltransferase family [Yersinia thracica]
MLTHHLFAFPDHVPYDANIINSLPFIGASVDNYLANFGKICVAIFLFMSGYGYSFKNKINFKYSIDKLKKLYFSFWLVFVIFIPIGFLFVSNNWNDSSPIRLVKNIIGVSSDYNGEWWFIRLYVVYVLALPIISRLPPTTLLIISLVSIVIGFFFEQHGGLVVLLIWLYPFLIGYFFGKKNEKITKYKNTIKQSYFNIIGVLLTVVLFYLFDMFGLILSSPLFVMILCDIYRKKTHHTMVTNLGKYSMYMWLTHSFFCYYYTPEIIYSVRYSPFTLLLLIVISFLTSVILTHMEFMIKNSYKKLKLSFATHN